MSIDEYQYEDERGLSHYLSRGEKRLLKGIYRWLVWLNKIYPNLVYSKLELEDYNKYREELNRQASPASPVTNIPSIVPSMQSIALNTNVK